MSEGESGATNVDAMNLGNKPCSFDHLTTNVRCFHPTDRLSSHQHMLQREGKNNIQDRSSGDPYASFDHSIFSVTAQT